jgi:hypothetical protein
MSLVGSFFVFISIIASGYVSNADIDDEQKTKFNIGLVVVWLVIIIGSIIFA